MLKTGIKRFVAMSNPLRCCDTSAFAQSYRLSAGFQRGPSWLFIHRRCRWSVWGFLRLMSRRLPWKA